MCPWHAAAFCLKTGRAVRGPVLDSIPTYEVSIENGGEIFVEIPSSAEPDFLLPTFTPRDLTNEKVFVIVGGGAAGSACCEELRASGFSGRIVMLSAEQHLPIDRPVLSKNLSKRSSEILLREPEFFDELQVEVELGAEVQGIDVEKKKVKYKNNINRGGRGEFSELKYDKILIATGGRARRSTIKGLVSDDSDSSKNNDQATLQTPGVFCVRNSRDSEGLDRATNHMQQVVVVGGGFIGVECAGTLVRKGCDVSLVIKDAYPLERVVGARIGQAIGAFLEKKGIKILAECEAVAIQGSSSRGSEDEKSSKRPPGDLKSVLVRHVKSGEEKSIPAQVCVVGTGIVPNTQFLNDNLISSKNNIKKCSRDQSVLVDVFLRTSVEDVYAAGDVATVISPQGHARRIEHWHLAASHGRLAARSMLGLRPLESVIVDTSPGGDPSAWEDHHDIKGGDNANANTTSRSTLTTTSKSSTKSEIEIDSSKTITQLDIVPFFWTVLCGRTLKYTGHVKDIKKCEIMVQGDLDKLHFVI